MTDEVIVYTKDEFLSTTTPYDQVYEYRDDPFQHGIEIEKMSAIANRVGVRNFKRLYQNYQKSLKMQSGSNLSNSSDFEGQPIDLEVGEWTANDDGVFKYTDNGAVHACYHAIMPVERLVNVDTKLEKIRIAYKRGLGSAGWRNQIFEKNIIANSRSIVNLAEYGISVTSESAKYLVQFLSDVESMNYERIPENNSVTRLGWIDGEGFAPYIERLIYDGDESFSQFYENIRPKGNLDEWIKIAKKVRKNLHVRILLAASFASVLVKPTQSLPFFVHLWGGSENGKTVALMLCASVWGNPEIGKYPVTFNNTYVFQEQMAGFLNSLPLILNELQVDKGKDFDQMIYKLCEGSGRGRGSKNGGVRKTVEWRNCTITNGEQPLSSASSGGGAVNRIIDLNCGDNALFEDPRQLVKDILKHYGLAGQAFVEALSDSEYMEKTTDMAESYKREMASCTDATEKQIAAASLMITADNLIADLFFDGEDKLTISDMSRFLLSKSEMLPSFRAYEWLKGWIGENSNKFSKNSQEIYGEFNERIVDGFMQKYVYIYRNVFNEACEKAGFNSVSFLEWLRKEEKIEVGKKGFTKTWWNGQTHIPCIFLKLEGPYIEDEDGDEVPF